MASTKRVLLVEDEKLTLLTLTNLHHSGYIVDSAPEGTTKILQLFHLVISDITMSGIALLARSKNAPKWNGVYLLFFSILFISALPLPLF